MVLIKYSGKYVKIYFNMKITYFCFSLASLACVMSPRDMRLCPGVGGRKCGAYPSPVFRDPHPTCVMCRGRNCASDSTCSTCQDWSLAQWEAFHAKRSYADRKKPNSCHAGVPTSLTSETPFSSAAVKQAAPSLASLPLPAPPPSEDGRQPSSVFSHSN